MTTLLTHKLRGKRDLLRLRQRARQITRSLGYGPHDQAMISAAVFQLGCWAWERGERWQIGLDAAEGKLRAEPGRRSSTEDAGDGESVRLEWPLPESGPLAADDLTAAAAALDALTPLDVFDEVRQINQELLQTLRELQQCRATVLRLRKKRGDAA